VDAKTFGYRLIQPIIKKITVAIIYCHPNNDIKAFLDSLDNKGRLAGRTVCLLDTSEIS